MSARKAFSRAVRGTIRAAGTILVFLALLYGLAPPFILPGIIRRAAFPALEEALATRVHVDGVRVGYLGSVVLTGVRVEDASDSEPVVAASRVVVVPDLGALARGRLEFDRVEADEVVARLVRRSDGSTNLDRLVAALRQRTAAAPPAALQVRRWRVDRGRVIVSDRRRGLAAEVADVAAAGGPTGQDGAQAVTGVCRVSDVECRIAAAWRMGNVRPRSSFDARRSSLADEADDRLTLRLEWRPVAGSAAEPMAVGPVRAVTAGHVTLALQPDGRLRAEGTARLEQVRLAPDDSRLPVVEADWIEVRPDLVLDPAVLARLLEAAPPPAAGPDSPQRMQEDRGSESTAAESASAAFASLGVGSGRVAAAWRGLRVDSREGLSGLRSDGVLAGLGLPETVRGAKLTTDGRAEFAVADGRLRRVSGAVAARDLTVVAGPRGGAETVVVAVPEAQAAGELAFVRGRPVGAVDVKVDGLDAGAVMKALASGDRLRLPGVTRIGDRLPRLAGVLRYAGRAGVTEEGRVTLEGAGRLVRLAVGSAAVSPLTSQGDPLGTGRSEGRGRSAEYHPTLTQPSPWEGEGSAAGAAGARDAALDFSHTLAVDPDTPGRGVVGAMDYRIVHLDVQSVLAEVDRLWPGAGVCGVAVSGALDASGTAALTCDSVGRRLVLGAAGALTRARVAGRTLCPERRRAEMRVDLSADLAGGPLSGVAEAIVNEVDLAAALEASGLSLPARCAGTLDGRCRVAFESGRPTRIEAAASAGDVQVLDLAGARRLAPGHRPLDLGPVQVTAEVAVSSGRLDVARAAVASRHVKARVSGAFERPPAGGWEGEAKGEGALEMGTLLADLRGAGLLVPAEQALPARPHRLDAGGGVSVAVRVSLDDSRLRAEGTARPDASGSLAWGRFLHIPRGTEAEVGFALGHPLGSKVVTLDDVSVALPSPSGELAPAVVSASASGRLDLGAETVEVAFTAAVSDAGRAGALCPLLREVDARGAVRVTGSLSGPLAAPRVTAAAKLEDLSVDAGGAPGERVGFSGTVNMERWQAAFQEMAVTWGEDRFQVVGEADLSPGRRPSARLRVSGRRLDLEAMTQSDVFQEFPAWVGPLRQIDLEAVAAFDEVDVGLVLLERATAAGTLKDGRVRIEPAVTFVGDGAVSAVCAMDLSDTRPALVVTFEGAGIRARGRIAELLAEHASVLRLRGPAAVTGTLAFPLLTPAGRPWPTGRVRAVWQDGRIEGEPGPDWLPRIFNNLRLDRYPFGLMAVDAALEEGNQARLVAFFDSQAFVDLTAEVSATSAGTLRVDAGVDLLASVNPDPVLFKPERPYAVRIYSVQEAWVEGRRVVHAGGFRSAADVSYDVLVRRNAVVRRLAEAGGEVGRGGLKLLEHFVPLRAIDELLRGVTRRGVDRLW